MQRIRNTAALEALKLCWKHYPWRVKEAHQLQQLNALVQFKSAMAGAGVKVSTGLMEALLK